ncbi:zincin-like metallopeptidase domain-containing protein [Bacteroides fragilis]|nr:zincin-like metallopeptidase domain-containing protein [Bacteroides fragilis]
MIALLYLLKSQFKDGESFYGTELHEMGHSTGVKNRLNRKGFYENDKFNYGREELVAELISALSGVYLGISVTVREENAAYLKSWCKAIKEEPKFLFTVLADAIKGSKFIAQHLNIRLDVEEVEEEKNTKGCLRFLPPYWGSSFSNAKKEPKKA